MNYKFHMHDFLSCRGYTRTPLIERSSLLIRQSVARSASCGVDECLVGIHPELQRNSFIRIENMLDLFLANVGSDIKKLPSKRKRLDSNPMFENVQDLDGFRVGFLRPDLLSKFCKRFALNASDSECIMMQTSCLTVPHVHEVGHSTFLPLGREEGFPDSEGGTYLGQYDDTSSYFNLTFEPARSGQTFEIKAGEIHCFAPTAKEFSALAFVSPRIQQQNGSFDITRFGAPLLSDDRQIATVYRQKPYFTF